MDARQIIRLKSSERCSNHWHMAIDKVLPAEAKSEKSKMYMPVLVVTGSSPSGGTAALAGGTGSSARPANGIDQCDVRVGARYPRAVAAWLAVWCLVRLGKVSNLRRSGAGYWLQGRPLLL